MLTLALDTSTEIGSLALGDDRAVLWEVRLQVRGAHSEVLLPELDRRVRGSGLDPRQIERIVVGAGPGSFTGVRIAAAIAKGIRAANDAELFAYSSLAAIAVGSGAAGFVCAAIDARRAQVYSAGFAIGPHGDELKLIHPPAAGGFDELCARLEPPEGWVLAAMLPETLLEIARERGIRVLERSAGEPRASALLRLASSDPATGRVPNPDAWEPAYLRASSAERGSVH